LFGRVTYELMASYWPTPVANEDDPRVAARMNEIFKIVVSPTLDKADWHNTRLIRDDIAGALTEIKQQPGRDIAIFGSSALTVSPLQHGLIDELRIMVNPIILGAGKVLVRDRRPEGRPELAGGRAVQVWQRPAPLRAGRSPRVTAEPEGREVAAAAMTAGRA
jgi:dihydrofolate reductase